MRLLRCFCKIAFLSIVFAITPYVAYTQVRCGTVEYTEKLKAQKNLFENNVDFEQWLQLKQQEKAGKSGSQRTASTYQVPVVVHVIHNGEPVGEGKNISDAQIASQLSVLNKDYKRLNADIGNTPSEFLSVAGAFDIEFVLAKQNPEGLATDGIVRVQGTKTSWTMNDNYTLKSLSYWPAEDYLNIWVCNLTDFLGYSQFPVSGLPGLENSSTNSLTDGVVITYNVFGSIEDGAFDLQANYNKGRTATHEIGHFFGLRHIWGDDNGGCSGTDYVDDTPNQAGSTSACPAHPRVTCTDIISMFQNYLDYTYDNCMNLFTQGQASRMTTIIENSPRRASLTTSHGLAEPAVVANDLGIKDIISPIATECSAPFVPELEVRNYGNNTITSARIRIRKDGVITETKDFSFSPGLALLESTTVDFSSLSFSSGNHNVSFEILLTNMVTDANPANNTMGQNVFIPQSIPIPFSESFSALPGSWSIVNPDQDITWDLAVTPIGGTNNALKMEFYNYEDHLGEIDLLITPLFDLSTAPAALLKFDVAYSRYQSSSDGLKVILLSNCNMDITQGTIVYDKAGASLATTPSSTSDFTPSSPDQWRNESIDLSLYIGQNNLQLAFVGFNDWGNNLYVDNISLTTSPIHDVTLKQVIAPAPVTCLNQSSPKLHIKNAGTLISFLKVVAIINGQTSTQSFTGLSMAGNTEMDLELTSIALTDGENEISFELTEPDGNPDFNPADNLKQVKTIVDKANDQIPLRQNFEGSFEDQWTIINPSGGMNWEKIDVDPNTALYFDAFSNTLSGDEAWFVSPVLDFSDVEEASLSYDLSYAYRTGTSDLLYILASTDCGNMYNDTIFSASGFALSDGRNSSTSWKPAGQSDWTTKSQDLSSLAGNPNVRIAFVFKNNNGNNIYLDNIEFFVSSSPIKFSENFAVYPNPAENGNANITFNLPEKGTVNIDVIDSMGKVLISETLPNILNQTFGFSLTSQATGVYVVRVITGDKVFFKKLIVVR